MPTIEERISGLERFAREQGKSPYNNSKSEKHVRMIFIELADGLADVVKEIQAAEAFGFRGPGLATLLEPQQKILDEVAQVTPQPLRTFIATPGKLEEVLNDPDTLADHESRIRALESRFNEKVT